jgi:hypothetical protein
MISPRAVHVLSDPSYPIIRVSYPILRSPIDKAGCGVRLPWASLELRGLCGESKLRMLCVPFAFGCYACPSPSDVPFWTPRLCDP